MKQIIKAGTTSKRLVIFVQDASKTTGVGLKGLTNASSGLIWYYYRDDQTSATVVSIVGETIGTWTSGGFVEIDSTHMPGFYEIGVPNAAIAATNSPTWVYLQLSGAANMVPVNLELELSAFDLTTATQPVNVQQWLGTAVTAVTGGIPDVNVKNYNNQTAQTDANNLPKVDVEDWHATAVTVNVAGVPKVDVVDWLGTAVTAVTGGVPDVNVKNYNNVVAQTDINNLPKVDVEDIKAVAVNTAVAQVGANVVQFAGAAAALDANNLPKVDTEDWKGTAVLVPTVGGRPMVETVVNDDKTGYSLTQVFPANFSSLVIDANGRVDLSKVLGITINPLISGRVDAVASVVSDKTGYSLASGQFEVKKNQALNGFTFPMYNKSGVLQTGLVVSANRSIDGGSVAPCANAVSEVGSGLYQINLAGSDLNGTTITLIFTAPAAFDTTITVVTQA